VGRFSAEVIGAAASQSEVELTTYGRRTGSPVRVVIWVSGDGERLFVRSGGGPGRHWTRNVLARPEGVLHVGGLDVAVRLHHLDAAEARRVTDLVIHKYGPSVRRPPDGAPPTLAEQATFELLPA